MITPNSEPFCMLSFFLRFLKSCFSNIVRFGKTRQHSRSCCCDFNSHTNPLFIQLKILKLCDVIKLQQLKLVYEFTNKIVHMDLMN